MKEAKGTSFGRTGRGVGVVEDSPPALGVRGRENQNNYNDNAKWCVLVHFWFIKWTAADRRGYRRHT